MDPYNRNSSNAYLWPTVPNPFLASSLTSTNSPSTNNCASRSQGPSPTNNIPTRNLASSLPISANSQSINNWASSSLSSPVSKAYTHSSTDNETSLDIQDRIEFDEFCYRTRLTKGAEIGAAVPISNTNTSRENNTSKAQETPIYFKVTVSDNTIKEALISRILQKYGASFEWP